MKRLIAPTPPAQLSEPACNAWYRLYGLVANREGWDDLYLGLLAIAASVCAQCLLVVAMEGAAPDTVGEHERKARRALANLAFSLPGRLNVALLEADIAMLCEPLRTTRPRAELSVSDSSQAALLCRQA